MKKSSIKLWKQFALYGAITVAFGSYELSSKNEKQALADKNQKLAEENKNLKQDNVGLKNNVKELTKENRYLEKFDLRHQLFETMIISSNRGYKVVKSPQHTYMEYADTVQMYVGFNPTGLNCDYLSDLSHTTGPSTTSDELRYGFNKIVFKSARNYMYDNATDQTKINDYLGKLKNHNHNHDKIEFYYTSEDNNKELLDHTVCTADVGIDIAPLDNIDPNKPVLVVFHSKTEQPHRNGLSTTLGMMNYCKAVYGEKNVLSIDDPTEQKIDDVTEIIRKKYSNTRFDFMTHFEHHGSEQITGYGGTFSYKTAESKAKNLWGSGSMITTGAGIERVSEKKIVSWIDKFPGKLSEKRLFISECDVDLKAKNSSLRKLGIVVSPATPGLFNFSESKGSLGKEAINNLYHFDKDLPAEPQREQIKNTLKKYYDAVAPTKVQEAQADRKMTVMTTEEINKELSDPTNQIYINSEIVFSGEKNMLKKPKSDIKSLKKLAFNQ